MKTKALAIWAVLLGRPVAYRLTLKGGCLWFKRGARGVVAGCSFAEPVNDRFVAELPEDAP